MNRQPSIQRQRGISLTALIFILIIVALIAMLGMKVVPTVIEYKAITKAVVAARDAGTSVRDIQLAFDKRAEAGYIETLKGTDLEITKVDNEFVVSFAYEKKIPLFGPASLVIDYAGTTAKAAPRRAKD
ncbi:MAG: hypothetical protein H6R04_2146 [Burkholderiaceae bacterium]|nr:hypothetical protein [Burkholderiaceae bacterium]